MLRNFCPACKTLLASPPQACCCFLPNICQKPNAPSAVRISVLTLLEIKTTHTLRLSFFFVLLCVFFTAHLSAQPVVFAPDGAVWRYNMYTNGPPFGSRQYRYVVTGDTLLNGWNARRLQGEIWGVSGFVPEPIMTRYVATVGERVYHWVDSEFVLLYDFGATPGDTIHSRVDGSFPFSYNGAPPPGVIDFSYIVDSVAVRTIGGLPQRVLFTRPTNPSEGWELSPNFGSWTVSERVGAFSGTWFGQLSLIITEGYGPSFRCYSDADIFVKGDLTGLDCDSVVSVAQPSPVLRVDIGPNPFRSTFSIAIPDGAPQPLLLKLSSISGAIVRQIPLYPGQQQVELPLLPTGLYLWHIKQEGAVVARGKLAKVDVD